jgi:hypothetical protein
MAVKQSIWIGFDPREADAFAVARHSIERHLITPIPVRGVVLSDLQERGIYTRPTEIKDGRLIDVLSRRDDYDGAMSTQFAISRFLVPYLAGNGLALFCDADVMARTNIDGLFRWAETQPPEIAVWCVKHNHTPSGTTKMDGQAQVAYGRKNWSSVCLWRCDHPSVKAVTPEIVNAWPGRDLHQFKFLKDEEIGSLEPEWNHLIGEVPEDSKAKIAHFTLGCPSMTGYEACEFSGEWRKELVLWAK